MAVEFVYLAQYHIVKRDSLSYNLLYLSVFLTTPLSFMGFFNTIVYSIKGWLMMKLWPTSSSVYVVTIKSGSIDLYYCRNDQKPKNIYILYYDCEASIPQLKQKPIVSQELLNTFRLIPTWTILCTWWRHQWKHFLRYWPVVQGIHQSPVKSPHKGQWRGALIFSLICAWING